MASGLAAPRRRAAASLASSLPYRRSVLPNGLRVVTSHMPTARSVAVGLFVGVGSRHEDAPRAGISHMLEHLVFKGTAAFPLAGALSEAVEGCGGGVNASTDRELTVYTSKVPLETAGRGMQVVSELVLRPLLRQRDLVAEKPVIVDEIRMYEDSPGDHVFTLFDEVLFGDHPLGREIAGTPRSVRRTTREGVIGHWRRWYQPRHLVLAVAGAIDHDEVLATAAAWFEQDGPWLDGVGLDEPPGIMAPAPEPAAPGAVRVAYRRLAQGNLCLGMPGLARDDPDRWSLELLGAVLGDGMSSRLFLELRERRSLAYDVSTFSAQYADCGTFGVHAGFDPDQSTAVVQAILDQLERVVQDPISAAELQRARAYTRGRLELRMEDTAAVAAWLGTGESLLPRILTVEEVIERLEAVTPDDLLRVARRCARPDQVRLAVLGPFRSRSRFERLLPAGYAA
ncbi:MAG TPA: pitrilysin family protein [Candidatus Limnocylindria bacterium]|nr:pitrilysin family protein [Candidatus Limnocylindria bacterium]